MIFVVTNYNNLIRKISQELNAIVNMPGCSLRFCKSYYNKSTERDFHLFSFPSVNKSERVQWIKFTQIDRGDDNWFPSSASKLCSKHFKKENIYLGSTGRAVLKKGSIPCIGSKDIESPEHTIIISTPVDVVTALNQSDQLEEDMENYIKFKLVGGKLKLKKEVLPHKFEFQKPQKEKIDRPDIESFDKVLNKDIGHEDLLLHSIEVVECGQDSDNIQTSDPLKIPEEIDVLSKNNETGQKTLGVQVNMKPNMKPKSNNTPIKWKQRIVKKKEIPINLDPNISFTITTQTQVTLLVLLVLMLVITSRMIWK